MSLSVYFHGAPDGPDGPFQLASSSGWAAFSRWADKLPGFPPVKALAAGEAKGTHLLREQLLAASESHPPPGPVADTIRGLLGNLGVGDPDETASVVE